MSDYLWEKTGQPDPEIERLEQQLAPLAYRGAPPRLPRPRTRLWISVGMGAVVVAAALIMLLRPRPPGWPALASGVALVEGQPLDDYLPVGAWLETGDSNVVLQVAELGTVELGPHTRAQIARAGEKQQRLRLQQGTMAAKITAPPRKFAVETPHALAIDLGCAFQITLDKEGVGKLVVTEGKVALARDGREVVVVAGSECEITEQGPGGPHAPTPPPPPVQNPPIAPPQNPPIAPPPKGPKLKVAPPKSVDSPQKAEPKKIEPIKKDVPAKKEEPAPKKDDGIKLHHDSLRDLEGSAR